MMRGASDRAVDLASLPLPDHASGATGTVADAARQWRDQIAQAVDRDEQAELEGRIREREESAYLRGVADGRAAAEADGLAVLEALPGLLEGATATFEREVQQQLAEQSTDLVAAAISIARWALGRELSQRPDALLDVVASSLREFGGLTGARVYVHPDIGVAASRWAARFGVDRPEVLEDSSLEPGHVVVRTETGSSGMASLDEILDTALAALDAGSASESDVLSEESADHGHGGLV